MANCLKGYTEDEISTQFGTDPIGKCANCHNLVYDDGIMTCQILKDRLEKLLNENA